MWQSHTKLYNLSKYGDFAVVKLTIEPLYTPNKKTRNQLSRFLTQ